MPLLSAVIYHNMNAGSRTASVDPSLRRGGPKQARCARLWPPLPIGANLRRKGSTQLQFVAIKRVHGHRAVTHDGSGIKTQLACIFFNEAMLGSPRRFGLET